MYASHDPASATRSAQSQIDRNTAPEQTELWREMFDTLRERSRCLRQRSHALRQRAQRLRATSAHLSAGGKG